MQEGLAPKKDGWTDGWMETNEQRDEVIPDSHPPDSQDWFVVGRPRRLCRRFSNAGPFNVQRIDVMHFAQLDSITLLQKERKTKKQSQPQAESFSHPHNWLGLIFSCTL